MWFGFVQFFGIEMIHDYEMLDSFERERESGRDDTGLWNGIIKWYFFVHI